MHWTAYASPRRSPPHACFGTLQSEAEETTEKYGLEAGLLKVATDKSTDGRSKTQQVRGAMGQRRGVLAAHVRMHACEGGAVPMSRAHAMSSRLGPVAAHALWLGPSSGWHLQHGVGV